MTDNRYSVLRDVIAFGIVAVACPLALFLGSMLDCVVQGFDPKCAQAAIGIAPMLLFAAGVAAGLVTRGWTGLLAGFLGTLAGMFVILGLSFGVSEPVPLDPFSGIIATFWFGVPTLTGYGFGRLISRFIAMRRKAGGGEADADPPAAEAGPGA